MLLAGGAGEWVGLPHSCFRASRPALGCFLLPPTLALWRLWRLGGNLRNCHWSTPISVTISSDDAKADDVSLGALEVDADTEAGGSRLQAITDGQALLVRAELGLAVLAHRELTQKAVVLLLSELPRSLAFAFNDLCLFEREFSYCRQGVPFR